MTSLFATSPVSCARIAVERGIDRYPDGLTYAVPEELTDLEPGERVLVPLGRGNRPTAGYVIETNVRTDVEPPRLKSIARRDDAAARLPAGLVELARWVSSYYCAPIGMTLAAMLPAAVKRNVGRVLRTLIDLPTPPPEGDTPKLPPKQRAVLEVLTGLESLARPVEMRDLAERAGLRTTGPIKRLLDRGLVESRRRSSVEASWLAHGAHTVDARAPETLTADQGRVVEAIASSLGAGFSTHLLFGVTGSGKTEVYVRLIQQVLARGQTAIVLVPEISLTPQTGGRLVGRFPSERVAILHSGLTAAQRHQQWASVADGTARIVLGARSAVFAPVPDGRLGLIVVDEEHDASYKQDQIPRYQGRDVAVRRAHLAACPIVLGSATPSLESWHNATERGSYHLHRLTHRVPGMKLPRVHVVDFADERRKRREHRDRGVHLLGPVLEHALGDALSRGGQALLLLNRRGYANYISCPDHACGWIMTCDDCDVTVVYHKAARLPRGGFVRCHHCETEQKLPATCPDCGRRVTTFGLGTQRVEEELCRKFPRLESGRTLLRVDSDTMRSARDLHDTLERFGNGEVRVLVGTQMIGKGLDYPNVRLVGVVNADTAINLPDFRATERTFQLVSQVAGRCGRGTTPGIVIVQSFNPDTPAIQLAAAHDFERFATEEIEARGHCGLPPLTRMARIVVRDRDHPRCRADAAALAHELRQIAPPDVRVVGPAPCPIARIAGRHRQQVELLAPTAAVLQRLITDVRNRGLLRPGAAMVVDIDPVALL